MKKTKFFRRKFKEKGDKGLSKHLNRFIKGEKLIYAVRPWLEPIGPLSRFMKGDKLIQGERLQLEPF